MQSFMSGSYTGAKGNVAKNLFIVLSMQEKERLADMVKRLEDDRDAAIAAKKLTPMYQKNGKTLMKHCKRPGTWIGLDEEAIVFLKRMCLWLEWEYSENIDPTAFQLSTIVDKTLQKLYGPCMTFHEWLGTKATGYMKREDMRNHMDEKRDIVDYLIAQERLPFDFPRP